MSVIRELQEQLQGTQTAAFVTTMLRDISATKLQSVREEFEANRKYYEELHAMTAMVRGYAEANDIVLPATTKSEQLYIALTANKRFTAPQRQYYAEITKNSVRSRPKRSSWDKLVRRT